MMEVSLTKGMVALVDDADFDAVSAYKWHANARGANGEFWYACSKLGCTSNSRWGMHQFILSNKAWIDHRDGNGLNNQRENLRLCTRSQNVANSTIRVGPSGYRGVTWNRGRWVAQLVHNSRHIHLGRFATPEEAALAWDEAARQLHGEFARLNFPKDIT